MADGCRSPRPSEWGLIVMILSVLAAGNTGVHEAQPVHGVNFGPLMLVRP